MLPRKPHPLIRRWHDSLPVREIRATRGPRLLEWFERLWHGGRVDVPFDFCHHVRRLMIDITQRCHDFRYLQVPRILVSVAQARGNHAHGLQARVTPLRFPNGQLTRLRRGTPYHIQRYFLDEHEYLYVLTFVLPRFLDLDFDHKLITLFHELYHMSPAFDGDLRRHEGRCQFHTHKQSNYDKRMAEYARDYLAGKPDASLHAFLRLNFAQLQERHGSITGIVVPRPKIIPLIGAYAPAVAKL